MVSSFCFAVFNDFFRRGRKITILMDYTFSTYNKKDIDGIFMLRMNRNEKLYYAAEEDKSVGSLKD